MQILIAEDDLISSRMLEHTLTKWGYGVVTVGDGKAACERLQAENAPQLAILDWMMPEMDGLEVCRQLRAKPTDTRPYLILLTARISKDQIVEGLECGADDYITKPFDRAELHARIRQGCRILDLQVSLMRRIRQVEDALSQVKQLQELLPICCFCKKIRDDQNYWQQVDFYLSTHLETKFSHGICPDCLVTAEKELEQELCAGASATTLSSTGVDCQE
jgi:sigma-B regulation protein RsbU (phosphoserine phosphatase)